LERQSNQNACWQKASLHTWHAAQRSEQHRPGSFAPLTFAQIQPFCKISNASPSHKATNILPAFGRSYLPTLKEKYESKAKNKIEVMHRTAEPLII
jgi:hypothetical protein